MKKVVFLILFLFFSFLAFFAFSQNRDSERAERARFHKLLALEDGTSLEYSMLADYKWKGGTTDFLHKTLLLDLKEAGKWVYDYQIRYCVPHIPCFKEESFTCLESGETVKISYTFVSNEDKIEKYALTAQPSGKTLVLRFEEAQKEPKDFIPFVKQNFTETFISGLDKIRKIVFYMFDNNWDMDLEPIPFRVLWGVTHETDILQSWLPLPPPKERKFPNILHYNCDFDAKFGYPCTKDEVPAKNPKVLVIEKK